MRIFKRGSTWYAWVYDRDGRRQQRTTRCHDRQAAEAVARQWERDSADPDHAAASRATLSDALKLLLNDREEKALAGRGASSTVRFYKEKAGVLTRILETDENGKYSPLLLGRLQAADVDRFISARRRERVSEHTISKELVTLRGALKLARRARIWFGDPAAFLPVGFAPEYKPVKRFLSRDELRALLGALTGDHAACVAFMVATSAEWGAVERARREDVTADSCFVHVRGTKRATRDRHVPIVSDDQRALLAYALEHAQGEEGLLFLPWQNVRRDLRAACERLGIPSCSPNDLRRTCAKWLRAAGVAPHLLAPLLGHADSRMAERVYGRLEPAELAILLGESLGRTVAPVQQTGPDSAQKGGLAGHRVVANPLKMAPRVGFEPTTRGLTERRAL